MSKTLISQIVVTVVSGVITLAIWEGLKKQKASQ